MQLTEKDGHLTRDKNMSQDWLGADTIGYEDYRIKQMMPLPPEMTVMAVEVGADDRVVMRDCVETGQPYCLVLAEDGQGKSDVYPYDLSCDGGIDVRGSVIPIRHCPKCGKRMQPHMFEYDPGSLFYTCSCKYSEGARKELEVTDHE